MTDSREQLSRHVAGLPKVLGDKQKMVERGLRQAKAHCPVCGGRNTMILRLAPQGRDRSGFHVRWSCSCGFAGME